MEDVTRKDFFKMVGAGVASLFVATPVTALVAFAEPQVELVEAVEEYMDDPVFDILMTMSDMELFITLKLMSNKELSQLGTSYPMLCNRVATMAEQYEGTNFRKRIDKILEAA